MTLDEALKRNRKRLKAVVVVLDKASANPQQVPKDRQLQLRLMNLRVWSLRYQVPMVQIVVWLREWYGKFNYSHQNSLGFPVLSATGERTKERVAGASAEEYPPGSRASDSIQNMFAPLQAIRASNITEYQQKAKRLRSRRTAVKFDKPWRGNPWR